MHKYPLCACTCLQLTPAVFAAIAAGRAASSVLCAANGCSLELVDVGIDADVATAQEPPAVGANATTKPHVLPANVVHAKVGTAP